MSNVKINNAVDLTYPDNFKEMSEEELTRYFSSPKNRWGAYDAQNHVIISVSWRKAGFFSFLSDAETVLIDAEARMKRGLVNYQRTNSYNKMKIASQKAYGIRFEYRVNDSVGVHTGYLFSFKYKGKYYAIQFVARKAHVDEFRAVFDEVLKSIKVG